FLASSTSRVPRLEKALSVSRFLEPRAMTAEFFLLERRLSKPFTEERAPSALTASRVLASEKASESTKRISPSASFLERRVCKVLAFIFLVTVLSKFFSFLGPCATPPLTQIGERVEPCLARPVPFCLHGFFPPPDTSLLSLA